MTASKYSRRFFLVRILLLLRCVNAAVASWLCRVSDIVGRFSWNVAVAAISSGKRLHSELENPPIFNGKIHYFYGPCGHVQVRKLLVITRPGSSFCRQSTYVVFSSVFQAAHLGVSAPISVGWCAAKPAQWWAWALRLSTSHWEFWMMGKLWCKDCWRHVKWKAKHIKHTGRCYWWGKPQVPANTLASADF